MEFQMRRVVFVLTLFAVSIIITGCPTQTPRITHTEQGVTVQSGVITAKRAAKHDQYVRAVVEFPVPFESSDVVVQVYPLNGPGKVWVMDVNAASFTYFILATIVNIPLEDGTFASEAHFYDGDLKWVAVGY